MRILFAFILILTFQTFACAQKFIKHFDRSLTGSLGCSYLAGIKHRPLLTDYTLNNYGPAISTSWKLHLSQKNRIELQARFSVFTTTIKDDTIIISPYGSDPNSFYKYFDLKGRLDLISFGCSWQRYFGEDSRASSYVIVGAEFLHKYRSVITGYNTSSSFSGVVPFMADAKPINSLSLKIGFGLSQPISDNLSLFQQVDISYMIFDSEDYTNHFSPLNYFQELLLNLSVGLSFQHKKALELVPLK